MRFIVAFLLCISFFSVVSAQNFSTVYQWMFDNGLTTMSSEEAYRPNDYVVRGEIAKFFTKFAEVQGLTKTKSLDECGFNDLDGYDATLIPHIQSACEYGLMKWSQGNFYPNNSLTKAEALTVIVRSLMGMQDESKDPRWTEYYDIGKWLGVIDNEWLWDLNVQVTRGTVGTWLWRAAQVDTDAAQEEWAEELKAVLTEIFGEEFWNE